MRNPKIILSLFIVLFLHNISYSQVSGNFRKLELKDKVLNQNSNDHLNNIKEPVITNAGEKSPYLGALFSGIIPGTGELYAKSYIKSAIFFAVEAGLWILYANYENEGDDQTVAYQNYANQYWSINKYAGWLVQEQFTGYGAITNPDNPDHNQLRKQINVVEAQNFSHQLPPIGDQQYYELIGKYQNFVTGWSDADLNVVNRNNFGTYKTDMFIGYSYDRQEANSYYDKGTTTLTFVILNHILSAADGAWSVSMFNKDLKIKTGVHLENKYSFTGEKKLLPVGNLSVTF